MGENSSIEWTTHTFNPWIGCAKVHAGCTNCYAEADMDKRRGRVKWGPAGTHSKTSEDYWKQPLRWNREAEASGVRALVFCASLADAFEDWPMGIVQYDGAALWRCPECGTIIDGALPEKQTAAPWCYQHTATRPLTLDDLRRDLFALIDATPWLDWLLLTKRPENIPGMWYRDDHPPGCPVEFQRGDIFASALAHFRFNVWIGTSVSLQAHADKQIPDLLKCRDLAPVLFLSMEPLLGQIDLHDALYKPVRDPSDEYESIPRADAIDWVIVGGESGHGARPMHTQWVRSIRDQCNAAGVPFFFKQWGQWSPMTTTMGRQELPFMDYDTTGDRNHFGFKNVGKKMAGRLLDGVYWSEMPEVVSC